MVVGYHLIWTACGWWLPNDPRGSSSHEIRCAEIVGLGELHHGRKKVQPAAGEIRKFYDAARQILKHELLKFSDDEISLLGKEFAEVIRKRTYTCYACALMPDHVHLLATVSGEMSIEKAVQFIKGGFSYRLKKELGYSGEVWQRGFSEVRVNDQESFAKYRGYIAENPVKRGLVSELEEYPYCFNYLAAQRAGAKAQK